MIEVYENLLASLFPEHCPRCGSIAQRGYCADCRHEFVRLADPCPRCGLARPVAHCPGRGTPWRIDTVVAPFDYAAPLADELVKLKALPGRRLGRPLGLLLAEHVAHRARDVDVIVPVPLHASRLRERGFNQAVEIARALARRIDVRVKPLAAVRARATRLQAGLGAARRAANLEQGFRAIAGLAGQRVAIVDDVMTTGATTNALAAALRARGAVRVEAWAVARTRPHAPARR